MTDKKAIGGYFNLEEHLTGYNKIDNFTYLKTGRSSLRYIIELFEDPHLYLPMYSCGEITKDLDKVGIKYSFYHINEKFEIKDPIILKRNQFLLYINFYGLKRSYCEQLCQIYGQSLIIDNVQDFYWDFDLNCFSFNSIRKFFGVPYGSKLFLPKGYEHKTNHLKRHCNYKLEHLELRTNNKIESGYIEFKKYEEELNGEVELISDYSISKLRQVDFSKCSLRRKLNFKFLHKHLSHKNKLKLVIDESNDFLSIGYPYLPSKKIELSLLWDKKIFTPIYWIDIINRSLNHFENELINNTINLPIDHRYNLDDLLFIINSIRDIEK